MGEIVYLRQHRKRKARGRKEKAAAENRVRFGMTRGERDAALQATEQRKLDDHRRDSSGDEER
jgi:Domain of unknown function (DUF4169)